MAERETIEDGELMDSGMFSIEDLTSITSMNETWDTSVILVVVTLGEVVRSS